MTKLEKLIEELCPNGVEYVPLWSVTAWDKKFNAVEKYKQKKIVKYNYYLAADLKTLEHENGNVKILTTSITDLWTDEEDVEDSLSDAEIVCIPWGGNPVVQYYNGKFITGDNRIAVVSDINKLNTKFLYYYLMKLLPEISTFYRGSGIKHPDMAKVLDLKIPLPPLEVQREIVKILDNFTELTAELEAELEARKKQYEYYRDELLTFGDDVPKVKLGDIAPLARGTRVIKKQLQSTGTYPVFQNSLTSMGFYHTGNRKANTTFVICAGAAGEIGYSYNEFWAADDCFTFECSEQIISRFLYYALQMQQHILFSRVRKASIPRISRDSIESIAIPVPSLSEQERIVSILDRFDKLCNDITEGLPAEIEARQKQYEYYRDKLLTFKELTV